MGWREELKKWLDRLNGGDTPVPPNPTPPVPPQPTPDLPPPVFTVAPQPFGVAMQVGGVEWKTDQRTSGVVLYRQVGTNVWHKVIDDSRQQEHQRTLEPLSPDTGYEVEVTATNPQKGGKSISGMCTFRTLAVPTPIPEPEPEPPIESDGSVMPSPIGTSNVATTDEAEAQACLAAGMRLVQAEAIPYSAEKNGQGVSAYNLQRLVKIARVVAAVPNAIFFLTLVNWNGASQRSQKTSWFQGLLQDVRDQIAPLLGQRLLLEGVSEPDHGDAKCAEWIRLTAQSGLGTLVGNGPGGRGTPLAGGIVDWHYCDINDLLANIQQDRLHSTDCTPALASNLQESSVREATRRAMAARAKMILYDTDNALRLNRDVLRWMQEELTKANQGDVIPHPAGVSVNLLAAGPIKPWQPGSLTQINPTWSSWLRRYCLGAQTRLVIADMAALPDAMRAAGFHGRDNALWYTISRSYAEWPWHGNPGDPDGHLSDQRSQLHDFWANYLEAIRRAMVAAPGTRAVYLSNDAPDRCGDVLSDYGLRQLSSIADRVERGEFYHD